MRVSATLNLRGQRLDLVIPQGVTLDRWALAEVVTRDPETGDILTRTPLDLTGFSFVAKLRRRLSDLSAAAELTVSADDDPTNGRVHFALADDASALLPGGRDKRDPSSFYEGWDLRAIDPYGRTRELYWGYGYVVRDPSR